MMKATVEFNGFARIRTVTRQELDEHTGPLVGTALVSVERIDSSWFFRFGTDITVATETLWRLSSDGRIFVTSEDHGHAFGLPGPVDAIARLLPRLRGRIVTAASIAASSGDLVIELGEQTQMQFLQTSCGYESWRLYVRGNETICMGGGEIVHRRDQ
jgi:hypothetical protein